jgi:hypothetical protein
MLEILDEIIEIPFEVFWDKFLEKGGLNLEKFKAGAIWFSMTIAQRETAFRDVASCQELKDLFVVSYLKGFLG